MQRLEVSGAVRPIYGSLGVKRLKRVVSMVTDHMTFKITERFLLSARGLSDTLLSDNETFEEKILFRAPYFM